VTRDPDLLLSRKAIMRRHTLDSDNRGSVDPSQGWELFPGNLPSLDRAVGQEAYGVDVGIRKIEIPIQHRPYGPHSASTLWSGEAPRSLQLSELRHPHDKGD